MSPYVSKNLRQYRYIILTWIFRGAKDVECGGNIHTAILYLSHRQWSRQIQKDGKSDISTCTPNFRDKIRSKFRNFIQYPPYRWVNFRRKKSYKFWRHAFGVERYDYVAESSNLCARSTIQQLFGKYYFKTAITHITDSRTYRQYDEVAIA